MRFPALAFAAVCVLSGCASHYITPSGRADFTAFTSSTMKESFAAGPAAGFPAGIAMVRVQVPDYRSYSTEHEGGVYGNGRYCVITTKEVEEDSDFERLAKLPQVGGVTPISPLLLPQNLRSDRELREAAARLKADLLILYTFDTSFHKNEASMALNIVSLGLSPTRRLYVNVSASALILDTRTGFIYGALESIEKQALTTNAWETKQSADRARRAAERAAFQKLVSALEKDWPLVVERASKGA
jgi:hypothetical protein